VNDPVMALVVCPQCGQSDVRPLAPGYYECVGPVLRDVVPAGAAGNPTAVPVTGPCGHRFQTGQHASAPACTCGMFAVGTCTQCGLSICGTHGEDDGGGHFVCKQHRIDAESIAASEQASARREALTAAAAETARVLAARRAAAPGFPESACATSELTAALQRLVPMRARRYAIERKSFGRTVSVTGWAFSITSDLAESSHSRFWRHSGLLVTTDGLAYTMEAESQSPFWTPGNFDVRPSIQPRRQIGADEVEGVLTHVLDWTGQRV
jgi:hypothetical protein